MMPMRHILIYHDNLDIRGGAECVLSYILMAFEKANFPYTVFSLTKIETFDYINRLANANPEKFISLYRKLKNTKNLYSKLFCLYRALITVRSTRNPNILFITQGSSAIHFTLLLGYLFEHIGTKIIRLPDIYGLNVLTGYTSFSRKSKITLLPARVLMRLLKSSNSFSDAYFLANSPEMRNDIVKLFPNLKEQVKVLHPVFDDTFFFPRNDLRTKNSILVVGRIHPSKNMYRALDVLAEVRKFKRNVRLFIVGDIGDQQYYKNIKRKILDFNLKNNVEIVTDGRPEIIREYMWKSKICWNLSEGYFGISNVESLACGVIPIVLPAQRSSVGPFGYVAYDINDFIQLTLNLLNASSDPLNMNRAYNWAKTNFSPSAFYSNLIHLLKQLEALEKKR